MSITIRSTAWGTPLVLDRRGSDDYLAVRLGVDPPAFGGFHLHDFLAAVEAELGVRLADANAIVIARSEVHPVETTKYKDVHTCDGYSYGYAREKTARRQALSLLAYAEYMDAHPRVDEAQVGALSEILHDATNFLDHPSADDLAYTVIATGRVTVKPS